MMAVPGRHEHSAWPHYGPAVTMGRRYDAVFMDLLASELRQDGRSVLAGRTPPGGSSQR